MNMNVENSHLGPASILVYVTTPDMDTASDIAAVIVEELLAACANILPQMRSVYHWQGKIEQGDECVLLFKTTAALVPELTARIEALHPFEVPCIVAFEIADGLPAYLGWIKAETKRPATE